MTAQEIFDFVVTHLAKQGKRAMIVNNAMVCAYRSPDGCKCAFGCLIPDNEYDPAMENVGSNGVIELYRHKSKVFANFMDHRRLISDLQMAHDMTDESRNRPIVEELESIALNRNLDASILKTLTFPAVWQ